MEKYKKIIAIILAFVLIFSFAACDGETKADDEEQTGKTNEELQTLYEGSHILVLSSVENSDGSYTDSATLDGNTVVEYDYTLHIDPTEEHDEVKNAPAEYYTGTQPSGEDDVYIAHDIAYYPELSQSDFQLITYDGEQEYAYYYQIEGYEQYVFGTLPNLKNGFPSNMMHSEEEAYENAVLHIAKAGTYIVSGSWHGQILVDLGDTDDVFADENAKVKLVLNNADVECTVAPSLIFYSVYECDNTWEERETYDENVDLTNAGAQVIVADGSVNNFTGANVYRMLKTKFKSDDETGVGAAQKKVRKTDGSFYSYMSMTIDGEDEDTGILNITSTTFEGLDTELHLAINGANVNIFSQDDGVNCNEDYVSVVQINGGSLHICAGLGSEGDGIDSNGFLVINDGVVISAANPASDSGLDSDMGSYINGGYVVAMGSTMDWPESNSSQATMNLQFSSAQSSDEAIIVTDTEGNVVFAYDPDSDEVSGTKKRNYQGAVISCPEFKIGSTYNVYVGGNVTGTENKGIYDVSTVTAFDGATKQQYFGTDNFSKGPGMGGDAGTMPDMPEGMSMGGFDMNDVPQMPDGMSMGGFDMNQGGNMQGGTTPPEISDGNQMQDGINQDGNMQGGTTPPEISDGNQMQDGINQGGNMQGGTTPPEEPEGMSQGGFDMNQGGQMPGDMGMGGQDIGNLGEGSTEFTLTDAVNCFSNVSDVTE